MRQHEAELKIVGRIKSHEGELNEREPSHVGGVSYRGVTQRTFLEWVQGEGKGKNNGITDVRQLVDHPDVVDAFYHDYLKNAWHLPECLQYMYCDFYTNGQSNATKIIQRMVGIDDDGVWGSGTTKVVQTWRAEIEAKMMTDPYLDNDLIMQFHDQKIAHYEKLATSNPELYGENLVGWKKRAMRVLAEHQEYFEDDEPVATAIDPADVPAEPLAEPLDQLSTDAEPTTANTMPYHSNVVLESDIAGWLSKEVQAGYILSVATPSDNKFLIITEFNPAKAGALNPVR